MYKLLLLSTIIALSAVLSGCNNDIFVEHNPLPDNTIGYVKGDGGQTEFDILKKGLKSISLTVSPYVKLDVKVYDTQGRPYEKGSNPDNIGRLEISGPCMTCEAVLDRKAGKMRFKSIENPGAIETLVHMYLDYGYAGTAIDINVRAGKPFIVRNSQLRSPIVVTDTVYSSVRSVHLINNDPTPRTYKIDVFGLIQSWGRLSCDYDWNRISFSLPVPTLADDGSWGWHNLQFSPRAEDISFYTKSRFFDITVPPNMISYVFIDRIRAKTEIDVQLEAPVSGKTYNVPYEYSFYEPISFRTVEL